MTCATCGAQVSTLDRSCGSCGTAIMSAVVATMPAAPETPAEPTALAVGMIDRSPDPEPEQAPDTGPVAEPGPAKARPRRGTVVLAVLAAVALIGAIVLGVSRQQVSGRLHTTTTERDVARTQLDAATEHATELQAQVDQLRTLEERFGHVRSTEQDERASLNACQDMLRVASRYSSFRSVPPAVATKLAANLVGCFEGKVPPGLFG